MLYENSLSSLHYTINNSLLACYLIPLIFSDFVSRKGLVANIIDNKYYHAVFVFNKISHVNTALTIYISPIYLIF